MAFVIFTDIAGYIFVVQNYKKNEEELCVLKHETPKIMLFNIKNSDSCNIVAFLTLYIIHVRRCAKRFVSTDDICAEH